MHYFLRVESKLYAFSERDILVPCRYVLFIMLGDDRHHHQAMVPTPCTGEFSTSPINWPRFGSLPGLSMPTLGSKNMCNYLSLKGTTRKPLYHRAVSSRRSMSPRRRIVGGLQDWLVPRNPASNRLIAQPDGREPQRDM